MGNRVVLAIGALLTLAACGPNNGAEPSSSDAGTDTRQDDAGPVEAGDDAAPGPDAGSVPRIDELAYYQALQAQRPDLLTSANSCYGALVLRQAFRSQLLQPGVSLQSIIDANDSAAQAAGDGAWIAAQQQAEVTFCQATPVAGCSRICTATCGACPSGGFDAGGASLPPYYPSGYGLCAFVGYEEGPYASIYDANGLDYKVFFEFTDVEAALTPALFQQYASMLAQAGFFGDAKILTDPSIGWQPRIQYNEIIAHGHTVADAKLAEQIGLSLFTGQLSGYGRGLDVGTPPTESDALDWHAYLCAKQGSLAALPAAAVAFVTFAD